MRKKMSKAEQREKRNLDKKEKYKKQGEEQKLKKDMQEQQEYFAANPDRSKSLAKAAGVKSVFAVNDAVYMTSFGKGNDAVLEKKIVGVDRKYEANPAAYEFVDISEAKYTVKGKRGRLLFAVTDNPLRHDDGMSVPTDMLCLKTTLERAFFGREFDDSLHIQLIYNILDIEKILAVYSTNAVYALNNMFADDSPENWDFFSNMTTDKTFEEFSLRETDLAKFREFTKLPRLGYFADAFYDGGGGVGKKASRRSENEIYAILAMLAKLRHWCVHSEKGEAESWLYKLDEPGSLHREFTDVLDKLYDRAVTEINGGFAETNKVNLQILQEICRDSDLPGLAREYYEFLITKKYKNTGFSIKTLREKMIAGYAAEHDGIFSGKDLDHIRNKLYQMTDFIVYRGYQTEDSGRADKLVERLRGCVNEKDKESAYSGEASYLAGKYRWQVGRIADSLDGGNIKKLQKNSVSVPDSGLQSCFISTAGKVSNFTKLIYLLTRFINGKEINDLLTTLINKFDNIRSFLRLMDELGLERGFTDSYGFFADSSRYLGELTELNSFARSCSFDISAKRSMYRDALAILGADADLIGGEVDEILQLDENGKKLPKADNGLRNFIISNVISSNRFKYLVRYGNPEKIRKTARCEAAVRFVLDGIPDEQITRYYGSCYPERVPEYAGGADLNKERSELAAAVSGISFDQFRDAGKVQRVNADSDTQDAEIKRRNQAVIRLYLTVMYLMLKNLVNVNARYVIGFHCLERDAKLYRQRNVYQGNISNDRTYLTTAVMDIERLKSGELPDSCDPDKAKNAKNRHLRNERWYGIVFDNLKKSDKIVVTEFRNTVCHLNAIRNIDENIAGIKSVENYFSLYHYIIQRHIRNYVNKNSKPFSSNTISYLSSLEKYGTYCKDFVKAYCTPFAYNLVRYKNLTIDGQFDRNEPKVK